MNQRRLDQLIVQARRRKKARMERLYKNYLGKRAEVEHAEVLPNQKEETHKPTDASGETRSNL